jgi:hypothetical protein
MFLQMLFKLGIPTYTTTIYSNIPSTAELNIPIAKQLPTQIGRIYGMAIYADSETPDNKTLISTTDAFNLYMTLKDGATNFFEEVRLTDMLTNFHNVPVTRPTNYLEVNIPGGFDLSTSYYINPTGIVTGTIALKLWYISVATYSTMMKKGLVLENANPPSFK